MTTHLPEFLRTDDPLVRDAGVGDRNCAACSFWSRWLPETGDCLLYALRRRKAIAGGATSAETPPKAARVTSAGETCDGFAQREGRGLSR
jgi:hypothetical protein